MPHRFLVHLAATSVALCFLIVMPAFAGDVEDCGQIGDLDRAITGCTALILSENTTTGTLAKAFDARGNAYAFSDRKNLAIADYDKALSLYPEFASAYAHRGFSYKALGDFDQALKDCDAAVKIDANHFDGLFCRGDVYLNLGSYEQAIADYNQILRRNPEDALISHRRGLAYSALGRNDQALKDLEMAFAHGNLWQIKHWQGALRNNGYYTGPIDGKFGPATRQALITCIPRKGCSD